MQQNRESINSSLVNARQYASDKEFGKASSYYLLAVQYNEDICVIIKNELVHTFKGWCKVLIKYKKWKQLKSFLETFLSICIPIQNAVFEVLCSLFVENELILKAKEIISHYKTDKHMSVKLKNNIEQLNNFLVERWHYRMLNDKSRNMAYYEALEKVAVTVSSSIIDVGSGTGLLSIFAQQVGFNKIYSCESSDVMTNIQKEILKERKLEHEIEMLHCSSQDINVPTDIPERIDVLVTEVFDCSLIGEGALKTILEAHKSLLTTDPACLRVVPESASVFGICIECMEIRQQNRFDADIWNICFIGENNDCGEKEYYSSEYMSRIKGSYRCLTEPFLIQKYEFSKPKSLEESLGKCVSINIPCIDDGRIDAVMVFFELDMFDGEITINTHPDNNTCWEQALYSVTKAQLFKKGEMIELEVVCNEDHFLMEIISNTTEHTEKTNLKYFSLNRELVFRLNDLQYTNAYQKALEDIPKVKEKRNVCFLHFDLLLFPTIFSQFSCDTLYFIEPSIEVLSVLLAVQPSMKDQIKVIYRPIIESLKDSDLKFDVVITEFVNSKGMLYEGLFEDLHIIRSFFTRLRTVFVPQEVKTFASLIFCDDLINENRISTCDSTLGVNVAASMKEYEVKSIADVNLLSINHKLLSAPIPCFSFKMQSSSHNLFSESISDKIIGVNVCEDGRMCAVLYWFHIVLDENHEVSTYPSTEKHWRCSCTLLDQSINVHANERILLRCSRVEDQLYFSVI